MIPPPPPHLQFLLSSQLFFPVIYRLLHETALETKVSFFNPGVVIILSPFSKKCLNRLPEDPVHTSSPHV